jgi:hypothetical protein
MFKKWKRLKERLDAIEEAVWGKYEHRRKAEASLIFDVREAVKEIQKYTMDIWWTSDIYGDSRKVSSKHQKAVDEIREVLKELEWRIRKCEEDRRDGTAKMAVRKTE